MQRMDAKLLIDGIVRQTTLLIAQLSTAAGIRAPLAHLADQVFLSLAREIEAQGVGRKVVADMFGLALRTYQKKVQRLTESVGNPERTLWQAVFDVLSHQGSLPRAQLLQMFARDGEKETISVLTDLVSSGLAYTSGRGDGMLYGVTSPSDRQQMIRIENAEATASMLWVGIFREPGVTREEWLRRVPVDSELASQAIDQLLLDGRVQADSELGPGLHAATFTVPVGAEKGWESAVYDHFQAVTMAIASKLRQAGTKSAVEDVVGGATLSFDLYPGHPQAARVLGLLARVRADVNAVWQDVRANNQERPVLDEERIQVTFYMGQSVDDLESARAALCAEDVSQVTGA